MDGFARSPNTGRDDIVQDQSVDPRAVRRGQKMTSTETIRPGEISAPLPDQPDAEVYFVGRIMTPWPTRDLCPRRGDPKGPECRIELDLLWVPALQGLA